jgi:hypothetical protein
LKGVTAFVSFPHFLKLPLEFVKHFLLDVSHGSKDDPIGQPWFDTLLSETLKWYRARYGEAMRGNTESTARGLVIFRGAPLTLTVPLTVTRQADRPGHIWLHFPRTVRDDEDPYAFLDAPLQRSGLPPSAADLLASELVSVSNATREFNNELRTADIPANAHPLMARIGPTLNHAVESAAASIDRRGLSIWDLNLVAELTLKVFLRQRRAQFKRTHAVRTLHEHAVREGLPPLDADVLDVFPAEDVAVRQRYGEEAPPTLQDVNLLYRAVLRFATAVAASLTHRFRMNNAAMLIQTIESRAREA